MSEPQDVPTSLQDELKRAYTRGLSVPAELDAAVLRETESILKRRYQRRRALRWVGAAAATVAAAASITVAIYLRQPAPDRGVQQIALRDDLDGNGRVDILDAFYLAKRMDSKNKPKTWDINGDGRIDQADVDAIAQSAVRVGTPS
jgi:hypothetical protein